MPLALFCLVKAYFSTLLFLGNYSKILKILIHKDVYTPMFIATFVTVAKTWKQPNCPPEDDWIKKMWYICTMEYYSAKKYETAICDNTDGSGQHPAK